MITLPTDVILHEIFTYYNFDCEQFIYNQYELFGYFKWDKSRKIYFIFRSIKNHLINTYRIKLDELYSYNSLFMNEIIPNACNLVSLRIDTYRKYVGALDIKDWCNSDTFSGITLNKLKYIKIKLPPISYMYHFSMNGCVFKNLKKLSYGPGMYINYIKYNLINNKTPNVEEIKIYFINDQSYNIYHKIEKVCLYNYPNLKYLKLENKHGFLYILKLLSELIAPKLEKLKIITEIRSSIRKNKFNKFNNFPNLQYFKFIDTYNRITSPICSMCDTMSILDKQSFNNIKYLKIQCSNLSKLYIIHNINDFINNKIKDADCVKFRIIYSKDYKYLHHIQKYEQDIQTKYNIKKCRIIML